MPPREVEGGWHSSPCVHTNHPRPVRGSRVRIRAASVTATVTTPGQYSRTTFQACVE